MTLVLSTVIYNYIFNYCYELSVHVLTISGNSTKCIHAKCMFTCTRILISVRENAGLPAHAVKYNTRAIEHMQAHFAESLWLCIVSKGLRRRKKP